MLKVGGFTDTRFADFILRELPLPVIVADADVRVRALNPAAECFVGITDDEACDKRCGDVLKCVNASLAGGCGAAPPCSRCVLRASANQALAGQAITRQKGLFHVRRDGEIVRLTLLVTASPIRYQRKPYALVLVEDVSLVTELTGLLPICASCRKIRDSAGGWVPLEKYIRERSEAEFTHDVCPVCHAALRGR